MLADAGYCNERDLTDLEKRGIDGYVALGREGKQTATRDREAHPATARMVEKLATPAGRTAYAERKWLSEAPNGWIKHVLGFRRFSLRGLAKVRCEWDLVCLALNVKRPLYRDGLPVEHVDDSGPGARARIQRTARPGDVLTICLCARMHLAADDARDCPEGIMVVRFSRHGPAVLPGPAFAG